MLTRIICDFARVLFHAYINLCIIRIFSFSIIPRMMEDDAITRVFVFESIHRNNFQIQICYDTSRLLICSDRCIISKYPCFHLFILSVMAVSSALILLRSKNRKRFRFARIDKFVGFEFFSEYFSLYLQYMV